MIKVVVVDIGNVLIYENGDRARDFLAKKYGFDAEDFWKYAKKNLSKSYCGKLDAKDFFAGLISELGIKNVSAEDMIEGWLEIRGGTSRVDEIVRETLENLKGKVLLGVLTNSTVLNDRVGVRKNCYGLFDFKIISHEVGVSKPEKMIYRILLEKLKESGVKPDECVFIDDRKENLNAVEELGIESILFEDSEQMIRELRELGVEC
jgi:epoxide hydrolase-like predicted phosphatase